MSTFLGGTIDRLARRAGGQPGEGRRLVLMAALVAVLMCAYTIAKVLRDTLFLSKFGALALPYAYVGVALASVVFVWIEDRVAHHSTRVGTMRFAQYLAIACGIAAAWAYPHAHHVTAALFYIWTGSQAMMLLPHFWALALDLWDSRRARRVFPILAGFGMFGGILGGGLVGWASWHFPQGNLMWAFPVLLACAHALTLTVEGQRSERPEREAVPSSVSVRKIITRSRYINTLIAALALAVVVGTLVDFQFKYWIARLYPHPQDITRFLGGFYVALNFLALLFQFLAAGWLLQRLRLGMSTALQPAAVIVLSASTAFAPGMWLVAAMRWLQGVLEQTLGKATSEIYYMAIRPRERRLIKPAVDTLVERWADAAVGVLLIVALHALHVPLRVVAMATAALCALWIVVVALLDRRYARAFEQLLSGQWMMRETGYEILRVPAARRALIEAFRSDDEPRILLALQLSCQTRDAAVARAVRGCLAHHAPEVRAAAVAAMEAMGVPDPEGRIAGFLDDPDERLRRAAVGYLVVRGAQPVALARRLLDGDDATLRRYACEALFERPCEARVALTQEWVEGRLDSGTQNDRLLAALALGAMTDRAPVKRMRALLSDDDAEVREAALLSATRRPMRELLDVMVPLLQVPDHHYAACEALAAVGDPAVPALLALLGENDEPRTQALAASVLGLIGSNRAVKELTRLARSSDVRLRTLGLYNLSRIRERTGRRVLARSTVHRLFLRELAEYRDCLDRAGAPESHPAREVRLLADSYRESAEMALDRAVRALACWYAPQPLTGVFNRLKLGDQAIASPALEFLDHVLPRAVFRPVRQLFEAPIPSAKEEEDRRQALAATIKAAWTSKDRWLRACAVRASGSLPDFDTRVFTSGNEENDPLVRAELAALRVVDRAAGIREKAA